MGAAACAACCAAPVLAFLGGLTVAGLVGTFVIGVAGLAVAVIAGAAWRTVIRRRGSGCDTRVDEPVVVAAPTVKASR